MIASWLDLHDAAGKIDHGKLVQDATLGVFLVLACMGRLPSVGHTIALLSASFGIRGWLGFLRSRTVTASETDTRLTLRRERDGALGMEPTP